MTAAEFVTALKEIPIDVDSLRNLGVSEKYIEDKINNFRLAKKVNTQLSEGYYDNPILDLLTNYDCSYLKIGMIEFKDTIDTEDYIFFGKFEIDDLAIHRISGEIVMFELGLDHILYYCSGSGERFLDAILIAAEFLNKRSVDDNLYQDEQLNIKMAEECGDAAGGEKYYDFYRMMFGV